MSLRCANIRELQIQEYVINTVAQGTTDPHPPTEPIIPTYLLERVCVFIMQEKGTLDLKSNIIMFLQIFK